MKKGEEIERKQQGENVYGRQDKILKSALEATK